MRFMLLFVVSVLFIFSFLNYGTKRTVTVKNNTELPVYVMLYKKATFSWFSRDNFWDQWFCPCDARENPEQEVLPGHSVTLACQAQVKNNYGYQLCITPVKGILGYIFDGVCTSVVSWVPFDPGSDHRVNVRHQGLVRGLRVLFDTYEESKSESTCTKRYVKDDLKQQWVWARERDYYQKNRVCIIQNLKKALLMKKVDEYRRVTLRSEEEFAKAQSRHNKKMKRCTRLQKEIERLQGDMDNDSTESLGSTACVLVQTHFGKNEVIR